MNCIAAVDSNWAIGKDNKLLVSIPEDMKYFRKMTAGAVLIYGRRTLQSFPNGAPLKGRRNIVLTRQEDFTAPGAEIAHSVEEALSLVANESPDRVFVIGGDSVYRAFLPYCSKAYITSIDYAYAADAWFPDLSRDPAWRKTVEGEERTCFDLCYSFDVWERRG